MGRKRLPRSSPSQSLAPRGVAVPADEYWPSVREICNKYGVLLIVDEVITGFGRTGKMFGIEHWDVVPDIMTLAKGMCSSYVPLGATIARQEIADEFAGEDKFLRHVFTFSGHPVATTAGLKNIEIIEREALVNRAIEMGDYFKGRLGELRKKHSIVGDARGIGLLLCLEIVADRNTKAPFPREAKVSEKLNAGFKKRGLILRAHGDIIVNMSPPLCITKDEIDEIVTAVDGSLADVEKE